MTEPTKSLDQILPAIGASQRDVENWLRRLGDKLGTEYQQAGRGRARGYTIENTLELAFLSALSNAGVPLTTSAGLAGSWVAEYDSPTFYPYWSFRNGQPQRGAAIDDSYRLKDILVLFGEAGGGWVNDPESHIDATESSSATIINRRAIISRVQELFDEKKIA